MYPDQPDASEWNLSKTWSEPKVIRTDGMVISSQPSADICAGPCRPHGQQSVNNPDQINRFFLFGGNADGSRSRMATQVCMAVGSYAPLGANPASSAGAERPRVWRRGHGADAGCWRCGRGPRAGLHRPCCCCCRPATVVVVCSHPPVMPHVASSPGC